uniref:Uncharacterized protein n=1 Tax=Eptatretus burgeri TaxID=7764 RepID=A0A8C4NFL7_EPTBU
MASRGHFALRLQILCPLLCTTLALSRAGSGHSLHPPYFNLATSAQRVWSSATCGEDERGKAREDLYCKLVAGPVAGDPARTIQGQFCDSCYANIPDKARPIVYAVDGTERWWQSPPLSRGPQYNEVNVTLDLGQLFHVAYVLVKFANSPRPDLWVLERSTDFGRTFAPWQYFAHSKTDCVERFGVLSLEKISNNSDVICTTEYSKVVPLEDGEIVVSLVNGRPGSTNFSHSPRLQAFTEATNVRLRFLRTSTLLGHLMGKARRDPTVTRRYFYSIKDISIGGRCVCHGHAEACSPLDPANPYRLHCQCQHNTCGPSCGECCPGFNQQPWRPATTDNPNECQPCFCHGHSDDCVFDEHVARRRESLNIHGQYEGGGRCLNCQHNTVGVNCEQCDVGFYRQVGLSPNSAHACQECSCVHGHTKNTCEQGTGRCFCLSNYAGPRCERCAQGFYGFPQCRREWPQAAYNGTLTEGTGQQIGPNLISAKCDGKCVSATSACECSPVGSVACSRLPDAASCICRHGYSGHLCYQCAQGHYAYPYCRGKPTQVPCLVVCFSLRVALCWVILGR